MTQMRYSPFEQIVNKQKDTARNRENSSRLAHSFGTFKTVGWGEFTPSDAVMFECAFLDRPTVMYGASLYDEDNAEDIRASRYPRSGGTVIKWEQTTTGMYIGAQVVIWVEDRSPFIAVTVPDPAVSYTLMHDFTFIGVATKDIPSRLKGADEGIF